MRWYTDAPNSNANDTVQLTGPRLPRDFDSRDFSIETQIDMAPTHDYQGGGIMVWNNSQSFMRFKRGVGINDSGVYFMMVTNGQLPYVFLPSNAASLTMRLTRTGNVFTAWIREAGADWQYVGNLAADYPSQVQIGMNMNAVYGAPPTLMDVNYFSVSKCVDLDNDNDNAE